MKSRRERDRKTDTRCIRGRGEERSNERERELKKEQHERGGGGRSSYTLLEWKNRERIVKIASLQKRCDPSSHTTPPYD